jgi:hypothetical protein
MPALATLSIDDALIILRIAWLYTLSRLLKSPHTGHLVDEFRALGPIIDAAIAKQQALDDASVIARAGRDGADAELDPIMVQIVNTLLVITKNDREDPQFVAYTGSRTPGEIIKSVLGPELVTAAEWVESLEQETDILLRAFAQPLSLVVATGQVAEKEVKSTDKALSDFRLLGDRKRVVDTVNAARGGLLGALVKFQHENAHLRLPSDWPASFFLRATKTSKYGETVEQAEESLARLTEEMAAAQANLIALKAKAQARETARATRAQAQEKLKVTRKEAREKRKEEKELAAAAKKKL